MVSLRDRVVGGVLGLVVGDAMGAPYEFMDSRMVQEIYVEEMRGGGFHSQGPGVWTDDSSLTLATIDALVTEGYSLEAIAERFVEWLYHDRFTATGHVFDYGSTTKAAIERLASGVSPRESGVDRPSNGGLMRILPVALYFSCSPPPILVACVAEAASITHRNTVSNVCVAYYSLIAAGLLHGMGKREAIEWAARTLPRALGEAGLMDREAEETVATVTAPGFIERPRGSMVSGHVVETLRAALWSFTASNSYRETITNAILLGGDTDTVAAVAGGLAGIHYGVQGIPREWLEKLARRSYVEEMAVRLAIVVEERCRSPVNL